MKKIILLISILLLFVQCTVRLMAPPLFVHGLNGTEKIDTGILSRYSNEDSLMTGRKIVYREKKQTITVDSAWGGVKGQDYYLVIKNANTKDFLSVLRKDHKILRFYRESTNLNKPCFVTKLEYYGNGILRLRYTEQNIQKQIYCNDPYPIRAGIYATYAENGSLKTIVDYDKEFTFKLKAVLKLYKNKIDRKRRNFDISKIFVDHPFNPKDSTDRLHKTAWKSQIKFEYPYWEIKLLDLKTGITTIQIIDGKTGRIIFESTHFFGVIA